MATTTDGETLFQAIIRKGGLGIVMLNADFSLSTTAITSALWLRNGNHSTAHWRDRNAIVFLPGNATGLADYVRYASDLTASTGALALDTALADGTKGSQNAYLLDKGNHPQWVVDAMNRALDIVYFENSEPLSLVQDAGSQATTTSADTESDADGGPATTHSKVSTADSENIFGGISSSRVLNAGAGGYIRQRFNVNPLETILASALARADVGTARIVLYDVTNGAVINAAGEISHNGEQWGYLWRRETIPDGCEILEVRWQGDESNADIYWSGRWLYRTQDKRVRLSTKWENKFRVPSLAYASFGAEIGSGSGLQSAYSIDLIEIPKESYSFVAERPGANPNYIQFHDTGEYPADYWFQFPIFVQGRRAQSDVDGPFSLALTETTSADPGLFEATARLQLFEDPNVQERIGDAAGRWSQADSDFLDAAKKYQQEGPAKRRVTTVMTGLSNGPSY